MAPVVMYVGQPLSLGRMAEGSDRVERCVSVNPYPSAEWPKARTVSSDVSTYCCRDSVTFSTPKMGTKGWGAQRTGYPFGPASEIPHLSGVLLLRPLIDQRSPTVPPSCPTLSSLPSFPSFPCSPSLRCRGPVPEPSHDRVRQGSSGFVGEGANTLGRYEGVGSFAALVSREVEFLGDCRVRMHKESKTFALPPANDAGNDSWEFSSLRPLLQSWNLNNLPWVIMPGCVSSVFPAL